MENKNNCLDEFYKNACSPCVEIKHCVPGECEAEDNGVNMQALKHYSHLAKGYEFNPCTGNYHLNHE